MNLIFKKFIKDPMNIGAIIESSNSSAKKIASIINQKKTKNILEIGGGTGVLSRYIKNKKLTIIERDHDFFNLLKSTYPNAKVINGCGVKHLKNYSETYGLFTSIPLMKDGSKTELTEIINKHIENGQLEWFIILGYRLTDQFKNLKFNNRERNFILINLPPAFIWHYY